MKRNAFLNRLGLGAVAMLLLFETRSWAQDETRAPATRDRIAAEVKTIEGASGSHMSDDQLGRLWCLLASDYQDEGDAQRAEDAYAHSLKLLGRSNSARRSYAIALDGVGSLYLGTGRVAEAENFRRKAIAILEEMGDGLTVSALHGHLAVTLMHEGRYGDAEKEASDALSGLMSRKDASVGEIASALLTRSYARCLLHRCKEGLSDARQGMEIVRATLQPDSLEAVAAWVTLGYALWRCGDIAGGGEAFRAALQIAGDKFDLTRPALVNARIGALRQYAQYLHATHHKAEARQMESEMAQLRDEQERSCNGCTVSVVGLSSAFRK